MRWYASVLGPGSRSDKAAAGLATDAPPHRHSSDVSIDHAIGKAITKDKRREFAKLSEVEQSLLLWNTKNVEYALGANISDLSMKFWDSDDRHAFEGEHVLLKQGYSQVVCHMLDALTAKGDKFHLVKNFPVGKVEYARKSTALPYPDNENRSRKMVDLSDTCCVTSRSGDQSFKFDFVVSALPLGVLKDSIEADSPGDTSVSFQPSLPFTKSDSIRNVGFGLLNKIYLQFPAPFWRMASVLPDGQILFGNASGVNPHHYMFFDMGKLLKTENSTPAILMTLISGKEAVESEQVSDEALVDDVLQTLRVLFSDQVVPEPLASKATRWGGDEFSRGCYTFLPPGTSDQDFQILQSPINGNGDSLVLEGSETMRLFWAGEHTTSLHPSMAHGALLSGIRAAKEVIATIKFRHLQSHASVDKLVPLAVFREKYPDSTLECSLCHLPGSRAREGSLLAFQKGSRQVLAHNNCAENSPEVEIFDGRWKNVIKAVNRGKQIECTLCGQTGATVGCTHLNCFRSYHFSCGEDTGWLFERDGKVFFCDIHRPKRIDADASECDRLSIRFYQSKNPSASLRCALCGVTGDDKQAGSLLAFQQRHRQIVIHQKCLEFTTTIETVEESDGGGNRYRNILEAISLSKPCSKCNLDGGTIVCSESGCNGHFHYVCAESMGWDFRKKGKHFRCATHANTPTHARSDSGTQGELSAAEFQNGNIFHHNLFHRGAETILIGNDKEHQSAPLPRPSVPSNATNGSIVAPQENGASVNDAPIHDADDDSSDEVVSSSDDESEDGMLSEPLSADARNVVDGSEAVVKLQRISLDDPWNISFSVFDEKCPGKHVLSMEASDGGSLPNGLEDGCCIVTAIDGVKLGSSGRENLREVMLHLKDSKSLEVSVIRATKTRKASR